MPTNNVTLERAARRFHHMAALERELAMKANEIATARAHVKELREEFDGLILRLRSAARDEGELPLFSAEDV